MESVGVGGRRHTIRNVAVIRKALHQGASKPAEFAPNGTQLLFDGCSVKSLFRMGRIAAGKAVVGSKDTKCRETRKLDSDIFERACRNAGIGFIGRPHCNIIADFPVVYKN
jgi:hypothetical protein